MTDQMTVTTREAYPIRQVVTDDLVRNRLTVAFRLILVIPHLIWLELWTIAAVVLWPIDWAWTLIAGRSPAWAHGFYSSFLRYNQHVSAYLCLGADPYPGFVGDPGYPVDLQIDPAASQRRVLTLFRPILAIPMLIVAGVLGYLVGVVALIAWFFCLFTGRMLEGMRNMITFCIAFTAHTHGYMAFLTDRYPPFSEGQIPTS